MATATALDFVVGCARRHWNTTHSRGIIPWLFRQSGAIAPASAVWICQHATGDWDKAICNGETLKVWRYDAQGLSQAGSLPDLGMENPIASTTPVYRFCVNETAERMIFVAWYGRRAGQGSILALNPNGKWTTAKFGWRS